MPKTATVNIDQTFKWYYTSAGNNADSNAIFRRLYLPSQQYVYLFPLPPTTILSTPPLLSTTPPPICCDSLSSPTVPLQHPGGWTTRGHDPFVVCSLCCMMTAKVLVSYSTRPMPFERFITLGWLIMPLHLTSNAPSLNSPTTCPLSNSFPIQTLRHVDEKSFEDGGGDPPPSAALPQNLCDLVKRDRSKQL